MFVLLHLHSAVAGSCRVQLSFQTSNGKSGSRGYKMSIALHEPIESRAAPSQGNERPQKGNSGPTQLNMTYSIEYGQKIFKPVASVDSPGDAVL
jgi:hypothetical protein